MVFSGSAEYTARWPTSRAPMNGPRRRRVAHMAGRRDIRRTGTYGSHVSAHAILRLLWPEGVSVNFSRALRRCFAFALCVPCYAASAQLNELQPGARIRIRAPGEIAGRLTGVVTARTTESVTITRPNAAPLAVPFSKLTSLDISRGKSRLRGAGKGTLWGVGSGLLLGLISSPPSTCTNYWAPGSCTPPSRGEFMGTMVLGSVIIGAAVGAIVGSEVWDSAVLPSRLALLPPTRTQSTGIMVGWPIGRTRSKY